MKKKALIISIALLILSCASVKNIEDPINFYLKGVIKDSVEIYVVKEKRNIHKTIAIFYGGENVSLQREKNPMSGASKMLFDQDEFNEMVKTYSYSKDTLRFWGEEKWERKDFNLKNFSFVSIDDLPMVEYFSTGNNPELKIFAFSDVIKYDEKYYLFTVYEGTTHRLGLPNVKVVAMVRSDGKWKIVEEIYDYVYY